jgi:DNA-binding GntR family transcriptional regulator
MAPKQSTRSFDLITQTYLRIRDLIASGRLAPGTRIIESDLARRLEVSRTPVRSALHRLQQERWVEGTETGKHLRLSVSPTTQEDARELFQIVGSLEGLAARWAAGLPEEKRLPLVRDLREFNEEFRAEAAKAMPDGRRFFELHVGFHDRLVRGTSAPRLMTLHGAIKPQADRYRRVYGTALVGVAPDITDEHERVVDAIDAGDPARAERCAHEYWMSAIGRMTAIIAEWGEKGSW